MSLNKVMLIGNVGRDPEVRYLDGNGAGSAGTKVATFTLATSERYRDRSGELRENTEWHNIVAWRQSADVAEKFVRKGTQLYIEGRLRTRSYTGQDGVKKYTTEITVDNLQLLGKRDGAPEEGDYSAPAPAGQSYGGGQQGGYNRSGYAGGQGGYAGSPQGGYPCAAQPGAGAHQGGYGAAPQPSAPAAEPAAPVVDNAAESDDLPF